MTDITLTNFLKAEITRQEVADFAIGKIFEQGKASVSAKNGINCLYRGPHGAKCAIGHLITDEEYNSSMDSGSANGAAQIAKLYYLDFKPSDVDLGFLMDLQRVHDKAFMERHEDSFLQRFKENAQSFYSKHNLVWNEDHG